MDAITSALIAAQTETTTYLWAPSQPVVFTPAVLARTFGDGRALFRFTTVNNRPRWWLIRGCSTWTENNDSHDGLKPVFDHVDEIMQAIAYEFGGLPDMESEDEEGEYIDPATGAPFDPINIVYPQIDDRTGKFWSHEDWPDLDGVSLVDHPVLPRRHGRVRILAKVHGVEVQP